MSERIDSRTDGLADSYEESEKQGQAVIARGWRGLCAGTRDLLVESGRWTSDGRPQRDVEETHRGRGYDVERLEYTIGTLQRCVTAELPPRNDANGLIPEGARSDDVLHSCVALLSDTRLHDPLFLRLAALSIQQHQIANLRLRIPVEKEAFDGPLAGLRAFLKVAFWFVAGTVFLILLFASPFLLAAGLAEAVRGNVGDSAIAFYGIAFVLYGAWFLRNKEKGSDASLDEKTYLAWFQLTNYSAAGNAVGQGLIEHLRKMKVEGMDVPNVAFDVCAALRARMLKVEA